ncbi:MAG: YgiQ family radical SAM protein [Desulfobacterales bacterium]|nr:YgiQ family radical SAM protein [Desulfobacterales bacterium]
MGENFLPAGKQEMHARGWRTVDVVLVTGDAYVDHPSFGVALIGRWLEQHGFRVAILAQPRYDRPDDFRRFGRPRLFFGISGGNLDSIVANYTGNAKVRDQDPFSPDGNPYFGPERKKEARRRPDRAVIRYANLARQAYPQATIVLGGLEASLRRFVHYDYQQARLRGSVLADAKGDLLVYGMGEKAVLEIARQLADKETLAGIAGTCQRLTDKEMVATSLPAGTLTLPSWREIKQHKNKFMTGERALDRHGRARAATLVRQRQQAAWILQHPPTPPLTTAEMDALHELPFAHAPHPTAGEVPAYRMIRHSVTIVRGCYGNCSYCAVTRHQGPVVTCRGRRSILDEIRRITRQDDFKGTISDLGGPTANMYATSCDNPKKCQRHDCLYPGICGHLKIDEDSFLRLLTEATAIQGVKHLFISSGLRMELLMRTPELLTRILAQHTPGALKIAPEHTSSSVLKLMHKQRPELLPRFLKTCRDLAAKLKKPVHFTPYFISAHPGCTMADMEKLAATIKKLQLPVRRLQDFTPTPGTLSTAMYVTGLDRDTLKKIPVARGAREKRDQRLVLEKINTGKKK